MSEFLVSKKKIDPFFYELIVTTNKLEDIKEDLLEPIAAEFKAKGYRIMVLGEPQDDKHFRISAFACKVNEKGQMAVASDSAEAAQALESVSFKGLASSQHEPSLVSFDIDKED